MNNTHNNGLITQTLEEAKKQNKAIYFLGCGGIGLSALMQYFAHEGYRVSGSDGTNSPVTEMLASKGHTVFVPQLAENISENIACVFMSAAVHEDNPELQKIRELGIPTFFYSEGLGYISRMKKTIAVAGSHGKTTTTAMIAKVLMDNGISPTVIVGSFMQGVGTNFVPGNSEWFVVEACEYHRSFLDLSPTISVITNIDNDHLDYYGTMDNLVEAFKTFANSTTQSLVIHAELPYMNTIVEGKESFEFVDASKEILGRELMVPGQHMIANAKLALAVSNILGIGHEQAEKSLSEFTGTWRRSEYKGTSKSGTVVFDDYAHHPTEVLTTLAGFRERYSDKKITVLFQPHLFSRTKLLFTEFVEALSVVDRVLVAPIYPAREVDPGDINSQMLVDALIKKGTSSQLYGWNIEDLSGLGEGDILITLGAGDMYKEAEKFLLLY